MEFKIGTKDTFATIMPLETEISANLTGALRLKVAEMRQSGSSNFIIDLEQCATLDESVIPDLLALHEDVYGQDQSLVFTNVQDKVMNVLKKDETDLMLNIARTMIEAIDIVSMEILERDLLSEE